jgi:hypothetical protein
LLSLKACPNALLRTNLFLAPPTLPLRPDAEQNNEIGSLLIALFDDLSDNPPSRDGTELFIPSICPTPNRSRLSQLTPSDAGLTSCYEKAQIGFSYPYDTAGYCASLLAYATIYTELFKNRVTPS